jgi:hypothetical protein
MPKRKNKKKKEKKGKERKIKSLIRKVQKIIIKEIHNI